MKPNWKLSDMKISGYRVFPEIEESVEQVLISRGLDTPEKLKAFLNPEYVFGNPDPFLMTDMEKGVARVLEAIKNKDLVCVYGDYDVDGVTSSSLMKDVLDRLKIKNFCYIPERIKEGYGLNNLAIDYIKSCDANLIITVDCGVSNSDEVEYAKKLGMDVVILDHHHVPPTIPKAVAVIDPKRKDDQYPEKELAGVGVAFKFAQALVSKIDDCDQEQLKWLLDLVALGTIADCVPLTGENRAMTKFGLVVLSKTKRIGLKHIFQVGRIKIDDHNLPTSQQVAFQLAPRINAAGRMDHANSAYKLLIAEPSEDAEARILALNLEDKNKHRQKVTGQIVKEVETSILSSVELPNIIIETSPNWELGVIGLAAGKIAEKFNRPTILLKETEEGYRGSGRSIKSINLIEIIEKNRTLLKKYGGHKQAVGLEVEKAKFSKFKTAVENELIDFPTEKLEKEILIDAKINFENISGKLTRELGLLEPFGQENREPVLLMENVEIKEKRLMGSDQSHVRLSLGTSTNGESIEAVGFGMAEEFSLINSGDMVDLVFRISDDEWNGNRKIQAHIVDFAPTKQN